MNLLAGAAMFLVMALVSGSAKEKYDDAKTRSAEKYSHMSVDELRSEAQRIKKNSNTDSFIRAGMANAMKAEVKDRRRS